MPFAFSSMRCAPAAPALRSPSLVDSNMRRQAASLPTKASNGLRAAALMSSATSRQSLHCELIGDVLTAVEMRDELGDGLPRNGDGGLLQHLSEGLLKYLGSAGQLGFQFAQEVSHIFPPGP